MKHLAIGVAGYDRLGRRLADAIAQQPDMRLRGVYERDNRRCALAHQAGHFPTSGEFLQWASTCDVLLNCQETLPEIDRPVIHCSGSRHEAPLFSTLVSEKGLARWSQVKLPCADAIAFARLLLGLHSLGRIDRLFATTVRRSSSAGDSCSRSIDSLEPVFEEPTEDADIQQVLADRVPAYEIRRVQAPYTRSHLHFIKLDLANPSTRDDALQALRSAARITVMSAADGFPDTAHVQEFYRDLSRPRGDRPELFIWEESVVADRRYLYFFMDVAPESTPVPEAIDAARVLGRRGMSLEESAKLTDCALGLLQGRSILATRRA